MCDLNTRASNSLPGFGTNGKIDSLPLHILANQPAQPPAAASWRCESAVAADKLIVASVSGDALYESSVSRCNPMGCSTKVSRTQSAYANAAASHDEGELCMPKSRERRQRGDALAKVFL